MRSPDSYGPSLSGHGAVAGGSEAPDFRLVQKMIRDRRRIEEEITTISKIAKGASPSSEGALQPTYKGLGRKRWNNPVKGYWTELDRRGLGDISCIRKSGLGYITSGTSTRGLRHRAFSVPIVLLGGIDRSQLEVRLVQHHSSLNSKVSANAQHQNLGRTS